MNQEKKSDPQVVFGGFIKGVSELLPLVRERLEREGNPNEKLTPKEVGKARFNAMFNAAVAIIDMELRPWTWDYDAVANNLESDEDDDDVQVF